MKIDGCEQWACLFDKSEPSSLIDQLPHMFVIKDLVVDVTNFYNQDEEDRATATWFCVFCGLSDSPSLFF
ncbi:hypothetical protein OIU78_022515, partial [Salix suchowensis]